MTVDRKKLVILYTELAGYTLASLVDFSKRFPETEIHIVRWPVNKEAPFNFVFPGEWKIYERNSFSDLMLKKLVDNIGPTAILCSGWMDKDYVSVCREWKKKIPVILVMDNKWERKLKQYVAVAISRFTILKIFNRCWVPGNSQKQYALRLGFRPEQIRTGYYTADVAFYNEIFEKWMPEKKQHFPHRFIYAGRYHDSKGVNELWNAFARLKKETGNDWELWCLGTGSVTPFAHPSIRHYGFLQPEEMADILKDCGVFILPSKVEPWGVVVHEFAAAGFPLALSDQVGATDTFLEEGKNGFLFAAGDSNAIFNSMKRFTETPDHVLWEMGEYSHKLAQTYTPGLWATTLNSLMAM